MTKDNFSPSITIVIPIHNQDFVLLEQCIDSILNQTYINWVCLLLIEDNSDKNITYLNNLNELDKRFIVLLNKYTPGVSGSLNYGIDYANTEYIARFDSDDIMHEDRLKIQYDFLEENKNISVVGSNLILIDNQGRKIGYRKYPRFGIKLLFYFLFRCGLAHPSVLFRRKEIIKLGMYNESLKAAEDLDLWLRMIKTGCKFYNLQEYLLFYRVGLFRSRSHWKNVFFIRRSNFAIYLKFIENVLSVFHRFFYKLITNV